MPLPTPGQPRKTHWMFLSSRGGACELVEENLRAKEEKDGVRFTRRVMAAIGTAMLKAQKWNNKKEADGDGVVMVMPNCSQLTGILLKSLVFFSFPFQLL